MSRTKTIVTNLLAFQVGWLICVLGGTGQWHWAGTLIIAFLVFIHLRSAENPKPEFRLIVAALLLGVIWDSLLVAFGILEYQHGLLSDKLAPHWIIALWALFAGTLNVSLRWLKGRWLIAAVFGAIGGPFAYLAGEKLGAVTMPDQSLALLTLMVGWAVMTPVLVKLSHSFDGFPHLAKVEQQS